MAVMPDMRTTPFSARPDISVALGWETHLSDDLEKYRSLVRKVHVQQCQRLAKARSDRAGGVHRKDQANKLLKSVHSILEDQEEHVRRFWGRIAFSEVTPWRAETDHLRAEFAQLQNRSASKSDCGACQLGLERLKWTAGRAEQLSIHLEENAQEEKHLRDADDQLRMKAQGRDREERVLRSDLGDTRAAQARSLAELQGSLKTLQGMDCKSEENPLTLALGPRLVGLLRICVDELAAGNGSQADNDWAEEEAVLLQSLAPLIALPSPASTVDSSSLVGVSEMARLLVDANTLGQRLEVMAEDPDPSSLAMRGLGSESTVSGSTAASTTPAVPGSRSDMGVDTQWLLSPRTGKAEGESDAHQQQKTTKDDLPAPQAQLEVLVQQLTDQNEALHQELLAERENNRLCEAQVQQTKLDEVEYKRALEEHKERYAQIATERHELVGRDQWLKGEVKRLKGERRDAHLQLSNELSRVLNARKELAQLKLSTDALQDAVGCLDSGVPPSDISSTTPHLQKSRMEEQQLEQLKKELASAYTLLATCGSRSQDVLTLRKQCEIWEAENNAMRTASRASVTPLAALRGNNSNDSLPHANEGDAGADAAGTPSFAQLPDGRQVELTGKVARQLTEIADLRERLRVVESRNAS